MGTTVCPAQLFWVSETPIPKGLSLFLNVLQRTHATDRRSHDGPSFTTVLVVREPIPKGLSPFLCVLQQTSTKDHHTLNGLSCIIVMTIRDPSSKGLHTFSKCPLTDNYDGPSYPRRSILHITSYLLETSLQGSPHNHCLSKT